MKKITKMGELAWLIGTALCALGVAFCTKASFGLSMVAAPPYILHVAISKFWSFYTHGTSEYIWHAFLIVLLCIAVKKIRLSYFFAFGSSVVAGVMIDFWRWVLGGGEAYEAIWQRIIAFIVGECLIALAVAFLFRTYCPMQAGDLIVVEIAKKYGFEISKVKLCNDLISLALSVVLSLVLTKSFVGVGIGTIVITFVNAPLIKFFGKMLDKMFDFDPAFPKVRELLSRI